MLIDGSDAEGKITADLVESACSFTTGETVEQLLNEAVSVGLIDSYTHGQPYTGYTDYYVDSITMGSTTYAGTADWSKYWSYKVDGAYVYTGINTTAVQAGSTYEFTYVGYTSSDNTGKAVETDLNTSHDSVKADWASFTDATTNAAAQKVGTTPKTAEGTALAWKTGLNEGPTTSTNVSDLLLVDGKAFVATSTASMTTSASVGTPTLHVLDAATGKELKSVVLADEVGFTCRPVYTDGIIVIPLAGGCLQGISATTYQTLWVTDAVTADSQASTSLLAQNGRVYMGTAGSFDSSYRVTSGVFQCVSLTTGALKWRNASSTTGYYWSGATACGTVLIYGDDSGKLVSVNPSTGSIEGSVALGASIRTTAVADATGTVAYVVTNDGVLHKVSVASDGALAAAGMVSFASGSTSTPTLFDGLIYVGGLTQSAKGYGGVLAIIDPSTLSVVKSIALPAEVKSTPLVVKGSDGATYCYFSCNTQPGAAYVYKLGDSEATEIYAPTGSDANYCLKSFSVASDGTVYYSNDSGTVFALKAAASKTSKTTSAKDSAALIPAATQEASSTVTSDSLSAASDGTVLPQTSDGSALVAGLIFAVLLLAVATLAVSRRKMRGERR